MFYVRARQMVAKQIVMVGTAHFSPVIRSLTGAPMVDESNDNQGQSAPLSERLQICLAEIHQIVRKGVEHPRFEFKREASPTREDLDERFDFIKLIQGVANSEASEERFVVIGA